ncbi:alanine--glyoxylate aminotransferase family protein [Acidipila sp. EB88]|uniref:pyridoxal-phosphate-dependent aminotransferase family protein n=1 Tax=Acidipila sp. EB88 TaxID=2305226 RepID=UPI000F5EB611|nr:aminotransferase class V-fold PLP-dependent enzyme [Acidipila sp. EB88]RRA48076.1 alanine--glyoxylate aminotransferase family protein [Acidipila sp. EB88]
MSLQKTRSFIPGASTLLPSARAAMALSDVQPGTAECRALVSRVLSGLKQLLATGQDVLLLNCCGTGAMEAAISNISSPGDRVLVLSAGRYAERWAALARTYGCDVDVVTAAPGETFAIDAVKQALRIEHRAVLMQATETSTGVAHPVQAVAALLRAQRSSALLVVDAIGSMLDVHAVDRDVDLLIGASEGALMLPAGLSFVSASERAWDAMDISLNPRFYFDLRKARRHARAGELPYTPDTSLLAALGAVLDFVAALGHGDHLAGLAAWQHCAETSALMMRAAAQAMGLALFALESPSTAVTTVRAPDGFDAGVLVDALASRFGIDVGNGEAALKGKLFSIAHAGHLDPLDTLALIAALEQVVAVEIQPPGFALGQALAAAQQVYASRLVV